MTVPGRLVGAFAKIEAEEDGASNENTTLCVPTTVETVIISVGGECAAAEERQTTDELVDHAVVVHRDGEVIVEVGVKLCAAKFRPEMVTDAVPESGTLIG